MFFSLINKFTILLCDIPFAASACSLYVVTDEPRFMFTEFSEDSIDNEKDAAGARRTKRVELSENEAEENCHNDFNEYDVSSLLRHREDSSDCAMLADQEILRVNPAHRVNYFRFNKNYCKFFRGSSYFFFSARSIVGNSMNIN